MSKRPARKGASAPKPDDSVSELRANLSRNVRALREAKGWNQRELGKLVKGGQPKVWEVESSDPPPNVTLQTVSIFAKALGVKAINLLKDSDDE